MDKLASANIAPTDTESISLDLIKRGVKYSGKEETQIDRPNYRPL